MKLELINSAINELIVNMPKHAFIWHEELGRIVIRTSLLTFEDIPYLKKLFTYILKNPETKFHGFINGIHEQTQVQITNAAITSTLQNQRKIANSPFLFSALLDIYLENNLLKNKDHWFYLLRVAINNQINNKINDTHIRIFLRIIKQLKLNNEDIKLLFKSLFSCAMYSNSTHILIEYFTYAKFITLIKATDDQDNPYWHIAMKTNLENFHAISFLLDSLSGDLHQFDLLGNSCLHVCSPELIEEALKRTPHIDCLNNAENTALFAAVKDNKMDKAFALIKLGANPIIMNMNGETIFDIDNNDLSKTLKHYYQYVKDGRVIQPIPFIRQQKKLNCGFNAAHLATEAQREWRPTLFTKPSLPILKNDQPNAKSSLYGERKTLNISGHGWIFSTHDLERLIKLTECESKVFDIPKDNLFIFATTIQTAIKANFPVIVPFATDENNLPTINLYADTAHWATIIGYKSNGILLAQHGKYYDVNWKNLFDSFNELGPIYPKKYLAKKQDGGWIKSKYPIKEEDKKNYVKFATVPETDLTLFFRRKLVVVMPPKTNPDLYFDFKKK